MRTRYTSTTLFLLFSLFLNGQNIHLERQLPRVNQGAITSWLGFAGGLNSPQFSSVDYNNDDRDDLFLFDRIGNVALAFIRDGNGNWQLRQEMLSGFPELESWVLLRDYNGDGIADIFTFNRELAFGVKVYTGAYDNSNRLVFERFDFGTNPSIIPVPTSGGGTTQLYVSNIDYPDISDLDCDGDLDVLTFNLSGGFIEFYKNLSVENGYGTDSLIYILEEQCYGGIFESGISEFLDLAEEEGECASGFGPGGELENRHVGSSLLTLDEDGDGDKDLILGDLSFGNLNLTTNAGDCSEAWMNEQDAFFPTYSVSASLPIFPAAYYLDIDGDHIRDLVAAPNAGNNAVDFENIWYYRNTGTDDHPYFDFRQNDLIIEEMIDLGTRAHPAALDYNADGLMDLVIGNLSYFEINGFKNARLLLFENTGTLTAPAYTLVDDDFLGMSEFSAIPPPNNTWNFAPAFGDMDDDGDMDALVGEIHGLLFYVENVAGSGQPVDFVQPQYAFMGIDVGQSSTPQIVDLNRDGLNDIVIGEKTGNINYFQNVGSLSSPQFGADEEMLPNVKNLGEVDARIPGSSTGYACPYFVDLDGSFELFVGTESGTLERYGDIDGNLAGEPFTLLSEDIMEMNEGVHLHPALWDANADGFLDFCIGNERGGLGFFSSNLLLDGTVDTDEITTAGEGDWTLQPNPADKYVQLQYQGLQQAKILLYDQQGRLLWQSEIDQNQERIDLSAWPAGLYFLKLQTADSQSVKKLIIQ